MKIPLQLGLSPGRSVENAVNNDLIFGGIFGDEEEERKSLYKIIVGQRTQHSELLHMTEMNPA